MFNEQVYQGPGQEAMQTYILEIAIILLGAFILGYLLRALLNASYKSKIQDLEHQLSKKEVAQTQKEGGIEELQVQLSEQNYKMESLEKKLQMVEQEKQALETKYTATIASIEEKEEKLEQLEEKLASATWPEVDDTVSRELETNFPESNLIKDKQEQEEVADTEEMVSATQSPTNETDEEELETTEELIEPSVTPIETSASEERWETESEDKDETPANDAPTKPDNLRLIEGIGPKIEQLLNKDGIFTFKELVEADAERIKAILIAEGPTYAVHDPSTWSEQSKLAYEGKWEQLDSLQESLKGGKRR
jgi:predicted flap endonuclease-1-like 5' DNA nuclease